MGGEELHLAVAAVEMEPQPLSVVVEIEGFGECFFVFAQAGTQFVAQTVAGGHEGFALVGMGLFETVFQLLHPVAAVELFGAGVEDVGTVVEDGFVIGGGV